MKIYDKNSKSDERIKILHLMDRLTGYGTTKLLWDIVKLSPANEVTHQVITFSPDKGKWAYADRLREKGMYQQPQMRKGLKGSRRRSRIKWFTIRFILSWWYIAKSLIWFRPDVIHIHGFYVLSIGVFLKWIFGHPIIHVVPSLFSQMIEEGDGWVPKFYRKYHNAIDCFFTGPTSRSELLSVGIPATKILLVRGNIDFQEISAAQHEQQKHHKAIREKLDLPSDSYIALSVGRLDPSKGHMLALNALPALLTKFPNLHWVVLGQGKQQAELENRAKTLDIFNHVHLLGHQDNPLPYYAAATVYLRTMIFEDRNHACFEAMAIGLPMVGFDSGSGIDLIDKLGHGILVPNHSFEDLSLAVAQILALPDQGREVGERSIEFSRENFDIRQAIKDMIRVSENLKNKFDVKKNMV